MAGNFELPTVVINSDNSEDAPALETGVSLQAPQQDQDTGVSLSPAGGPALSIPADIADKRAKKMNEGLGSVLQRDTQTIRQDIQSGREQILRQNAASAIDYNNSLQKQKMLTDLAQSQGPLDEDAVRRVMDPFNPLNKPVDPESVSEVSYAHSYINSIQGAIDSVKSVPLTDAQQEVPDQYQDALQTGTVLKAKMDYATKIKEDLGTQIHQQGMGGYLIDQAKNMFQPYVEAKMRGQNPDVGSLSGGILLGTNLQEQADALFSQPFDQYTKNLKTITDRIAKDNPSLAYRFAEYVEGLPSTDRILDNSFTVLAVPDYSAMGKMGLGVARKASLINRTNIAMKQLVKSGDQIAASRVSRAEALGDVPTATVERSTDNIVQNIQGTADPVKFASDDALLTVLNQQKDKVGTDAGSLSREQVVRIQDAYDASGKTLLQNIMNSVRINRIPMAVATQNAVRIIKDVIKEYYPGIRNAILDVSNPIYEPKSNTFWHDVTVGNIGGDLFSNPKTAENFAKLHGLDAQIVEGTGRVTPAQTEQMLERRAQLAKSINEWEQDTIPKYIADANNTKNTPEARAYAKDQAKGTQDFLDKAKKEASELDLRLKGNHTYDRAKVLEGEVAGFQSKNKELRTANRAEEDPLKKNLTKTLIKLNAENARVRQQELKAIREGRASVLGGDTIEQHGVGFKLVVRRPLVETDKAVRDLMIRDASGKLIPEAISTSSQTGWKSLFNGALGKFRGADDTLALNESIQRKIGTYSQSLFKQWAYQEAKYIKAIASGTIRQDPVTGETIPYWRAKGASIYNKITGQTHEMYDDFNKTLKFARDAHDPDTGKIGYFFQTPGELDNHYLKYFDRTASFVEHQAYFAFTRMVEGDRVMREIAEFRNRARLGVEQFSLSMRNGLKIDKSEFFDGIAKKVFPGGDEVLMVMGRRKGEEKIFNLGGAAISQKQLEEWRDAVKLGRLKLIEVYAAEHTPLSEFSDVAANNHIRYVLTEAADSKPIEFNHVNKRGGGHFEYDYDHYIKQAKMYHQYEQAPGIKGKYRSVYYGDTTFMPIENRMMGEDISRKLNMIREMIRDGDLAGAKAFTEDKLPIEWDELHGMFKSGRDAKGKVIPAQLDLNEPFMTVPRGRSILDMGQDLRNKHGLAFKDGTKSGSLNSQFQTAFNTERDSSGLRTYQDVGTAGNPLYRYDPDGAKMVDPIPTMNRALNRIINSTFMDDYKIYAVEHWLREAEEHLELKEGQVRSSPFWAFEQANDKSVFTAGTPREVIQNLLSNRMKIKTFTGLPNETNAAIHSATQWLVDTAYNAYGPVANRTLLQKAVTLTPEWMLARVKDPVDFLRGMTFHFKLGLFATPQLLVQMQTYAAILAISPFHGMAGTYAALLHSWSAINGSENIIKSLDRYATKLNLGKSQWRPGEFTEARDILNRTGFANVAGEYANLDTALKTDYIGSDVKSFLKAGTVFFEKGEQSTRVGAWYTAFREFREANPNVLIGRDEIGKILQKADLLTANMSRASSSTLHTGVLSLTTQFITYQLRMAELFMGTRLGETTFDRNMARLRLLTFYSALYGAPSAIGLTGLPLANNIREEFIQRGYTVSDNFVNSLVMEGLPAWTVAMVTGNHYNIGDRFGSPGFTQLSDALKSDHAWWQLLAGASGTTLLNTLTSQSNFWHAIGSMLSSNNNDKAFPLKLDDFVDMFKEISSVNQSWKLIAAINTGKWMSKNEAYIGDVTKANAAFMAVFGISPQAQDDTYLKNEIKKSEVAFQKASMGKFIEEYRRGVQAAKDQNPDQARDYFKRAFTILEIAGFPTDKKATAVSIAMRGYEGQIKEADYQFATKNVPQSRSDFMGIPTPFTTQSNIPATRREQLKTQLKYDRNH